MLVRSREPLAGADGVDGGALISDRAGVDSDRVIEARATQSRKLVHLLLLVLLLPLFKRIVMPIYLSDFNPHFLLPISRISVAREHLLRGDADLAGHLESNPADVPVRELR